jgi:hypothetical protein
MEQKQPNLVKDQGSDEAGDKNRKATASRSRKIAMMSTVPLFPPVLSSGAMPRKKELNRYFRFGRLSVAEFCRFSGFSQDFGKVFWLPRDLSGFTTARKRSERRSSLSRRDRRFESTFLRRRVGCELDFLDPV